MRIIGKSGCVPTTVEDLCFIIQHYISIFLIITGNYAKEGGDNIFGGEQKCDSFLHNGLHVPSNTVNQPSSRSSKPQQVCFNIHSGHKVCGNSK